MLYILLIILLIIADQVTKYLAVMNLEPIETMPLIQDVLHLTYTENTGAAFSIFRNQKFFLIILTSLAMLGILIYLIKLIKTPSNILLKISLSMILAGGIGNIIDRFRLGYVVDFIDFRLINFAIFNVADIFIVIGAGLLLLDSLFGSKTMLKD